MYDAVNAASGLALKPFSYTGDAVPGADPATAAFYAGRQTALTLFTTAASHVGALR